MVIAYTAWIMTISLLIFGHLAQDVHQAIVEERTEWEHLALRSAAISGLEAYRASVERSAALPFTDARAPVFADPALCTFQTTDRIRTFCYHVEPTYQGSPRPRWGAVDEESRVHILLADGALLARIPGVTEGMLRALSPARPGGSPLERPEDLSRVPGWETFRFGSVRDLVTFHGEGRVNLNTAPSSVLALFPISEGARKAFELFRSGPNGIFGDGDDPVLKGLSEVVPRLRDHGVRSEFLIEWASVVQAGWVGVDSEYYRVRTRALDERSGRQYEVCAVFRVGSRDYEEWREYVPG